MAKPYRNTSGLAPAVRTTEEARALAALRKGGPHDGREKVKRQVVLYADQAAQLERLSVNRSDLFRQMLDEWLGKQNRVPDES